MRSITAILRKQLIAVILCIIPTCIFIVLRAIVFKLFVTNGFNFFSWKCEFVPVSRVFKMATSYKKTAIRSYPRITEKETSDNVYWKQLEVHMHTYVNGASIWCDKWNISNSCQQINTIFVCCIAFFRATRAFVYIYFHRYFSWNESQNMTKKL